MKTDEAIAKIYIFSSIMKKNCVHINVGDCGRLVFKISQGEAFAEVYLQ